MKPLRGFLTVIATIAMFGVAAPSQATPITYAVTTTASGTLGGTPFTNALLTVTLVGDTSGVFQPLPDLVPSLWANFGTATAMIAGLGTATFNHPDGYAAVLYPPIGDEIPLPTLLVSEGFGAAAERGTGIVGIGSNSLAGYDLKSPLGPLAGNAAGGAREPNGAFVAYATDRGGLVIVSTDESGTATVTTTTSVPEPTSLVLFGIGALRLLGNTRRRTRQHS